MAVSFELPTQIERDLRERLGDLDRAAKEAALIELFRQRKLTHHELSESLGIDRFETDALLKRHNVFDASLAHEDLELQGRVLDQVLGPAKR